MTYEPTEWVNGETALSAENLNHIEAGIAEVTEDTKDCKDKLTSVEGKVSTALMEVTKHPNMSYALGLQAFNDNGELAAREVLDVNAIYYFDKDGNQRWKRTFPYATKVSITLSNSTTGSTKISFPSGLFTSEPIVVVTPYTAYPNNWKASAVNITKDGCDVCIGTTSNQTATVYLGLIAIARS